MPRADGLPDGMTVDIEGCLWVALFYTGKLRRYAPDGRAVMDVELPVTCRPVAHSAAPISMNSLSPQRATDLARRRRKHSTPQAASSSAAPA